MFKLIGVLNFDWYFDGTYYSFNL